MLDSSVLSLQTLLLVSPYSIIDNIQEGDYPSIQVAHIN